MLVKSPIFGTYNITVVDETVGGITGVEFVDKVPEFSFVIFMRYLLPKQSSWGQNDGGIFMGTE